jgi:hypothetical protein
MFKWIFGLALLVSIAFCAAVDYSYRQKAAFYRLEIERRRADVARVQPLVNEIESYQTKKDALQRRIDRINQLKRQQRGPAPALAKLAGVDPQGVESIAVVGQELVVNRR